MDKKIKVLIGSPIRQDFEILNEFFKSLMELEKENLILDYFFVDDNDDVNSSTLLRDFAKGLSDKVIIDEGKRSGNYECTEEKHQWKEELISQVAEYKNNIINYSIKENYDYLFLVDSDLVINPKTIKHLISCDKEIISEIFWTKWSKDSIELPQVWLYDQYGLIPKKRGEGLGEVEAARRRNGFLEKLKKPGVYEVGGLGACTLISREALVKGVNFSDIHNLSFWGEDRHFCIRAVALGISLFVDTTYPAYHIYRKECLEGVGNFKNKGVFLEKIEVALGINEKIVLFIKEAIKNYYTCDYRITTGFEGIKYFSPGYRDLLLKEQNSIVNHLVENKMVTKVDINDVKIADYKDEGASVTVQCKFNLNIRQDKKSWIKNYNAKILLSDYGNYNFLIDSIEIRNKQNKTIFGFLLEDILKDKVRRNKCRGNKVTLAMLVKNEENNFLRRMLEHASKYIHNAVILDDGSNDNTVKICKEILNDIPLKIISNKESGFHNEIVVRKKLWESTLETNPDWILCLDADEIFEDKIITNIKKLVNDPHFDYYSFRMYDMWDEENYREDSYWKAHNFFRPLLIRYQPNFNYIWQETPQHCGRFPMNVTNLNGCYCDVRLKHFGWSTDELRKTKYERYMKLDPDGKYGILDQYLGILEENPRLIKFV